LKNSIRENLDLENFILSNQKTESIIEQNFEISQKNMEKVIIDKGHEYANVNQRIKDLEKKTEEEPVFKIEQEKNKEYIVKLEKLETELLSLNSHVEVLEHSNDYLLKKKEEVILNRKKLINQNDELKREIENKNQVNQVRIQRKVLDNNSEEIQKLETHLLSVKDTIAELNVLFLFNLEKNRKRG
jgi:hypothetical protein